MDSGREISAGIHYILTKCLFFFAKIGIFFIITK